MFELSRNLPNLRFFDSHQVLLTGNLREVYVRDGSGVHITLEARKLITSELVNGLIYRLPAGRRDDSRLPRGWRWPLRRSYAEAFERGIPVR